MTEKIDNPIYCYTRQEAERGIMLYDVLIRIGLYKDIKTAKERISRGNITLAMVKEPKKPDKELFDVLVASSLFKINLTMFAFGFLLVRITKGKHVFLTVQDADEGV